ncbi:tetratricopeptide repeat protein [Fervidobacterium sp. 2310opik-2]|uniref:tetratricopeptide repeat protein n=1 Tax=Fervidobacterium sp. 2310opik-2 TaxID=1755815 RepID=UPI0013DF908B|nr:tetratricopeptide repeat protein [Fervidobacterium sp. 2310opik-2]KAF2961145.1 hypothetical protein AS161_02960 [Fervidobacterium sp. 2310opik-2]HOJ94324.1 tetratricopeptide repeat protein [Fervidobacterium nodosum]
MKRLRFLSFILYIFSIFTLAIGSNMETLNKQFYEARKDRDKDKINSIIKNIESTSDYKKNSILLTILADCYLEYGIWGASDKEKEKILEKAKTNAEMAIKIDKNNGRAYYILSVAVAQLIPFKNVFEKLYLLNEFDKNINIAIKLLDENDEEGRLYKAFSYIAIAVRYMEAPWPWNNYQKSEEFLNMALKLIPNYPNIYLELGYLYLKLNDKAKAKEMFQKVIESKPHPLFVKSYEESVKIAQNELGKIQ